MPKPSVQKAPTKPAQRPMPSRTHPRALPAYFLLRASITLCWYALAALLIYLVLAKNPST